MTKPQIGDKVYVKDQVSSTRTVEGHGIVTRVSEHPEEFGSINNYWEVSIECRSDPELKCAWYSPDEIDSIYRPEGYKKIDTKRGR